MRKFCSFFLHHEELTSILNEMKECQQVCENLTENSKNLLEKVENLHNKIDLMLSPDLSEWKQWDQKRLILCVNSNFFTETHDKDSRFIFFPDGFIHWTQED